MIDRVPRVVLEYAVGPLAVVAVAMVFYLATAGIARIIRLL